MLGFFDEAAGAFKKNNDMVIKDLEHLSALESSKG